MPTTTIGNPRSPFIAERLLCQFAEDGTLGATKLPPERVLARLMKTPARLLWSLLRPEYRVGLDELIRDPSDSDITPAESEKAMHYQRTCSCKSWYEAMALSVCGVDGDGQDVPAERLDKPDDLDVGRALAYQRADPTFSYERALEKAIRSERGP